MRAPSEMKLAGQETERSPHLDALRILASAGIVVLHYSNYIDDLPAGAFLFAHTDHFNLLVDLFFVISGFVIARQYAGRVGDRRAVGRFLWRRLARIYPLHLLTLVFYVAVAVPLTFGMIHVDNPARYPLSDIPVHLLLLHAIDGQRLTFNFPSWSLSAEMVCYLAFPFFVFVSAQRPRLLLIGAVALFLGLTLLVVLSGLPSWAQWINKGGAVRALPAFLFGMWLCLDRARVVRLPLARALLPAFALFVFAGWAFPDLIALALVYLVAAAAVQCDETGRSTVLSHLGVGRWAYLTYSTYMLHMPVATLVITVIGHSLPHTAAVRFALVGVAVVVLGFVSVASYRLFENPVRRRLNAMLDGHHSESAYLPAPQRALR